MNNKIYFLFLSCLIFLKCGSPLAETNIGNNIVAKIGPAVITSEEFLANYEFGFAHLKSVGNPKRNYLTAMINEKLLSLDGYAKNIHKQKSIQNKKANLTQDLLIEYLIQEEINNSILISENEIKDAINKSKVDFNLRYWNEQNLEMANRAHKNINEVGFKLFLENIISYNSNINLTSDQFETGYMSWLNLPPELMEKIRDLPINKVSLPILFGEKYWIFQVLDIRRAGVLESEYHSKSASFKKILFQNKLSAATTEYVSSLMTPKNVRTKSETFNILSEVVWAWLNDNSAKSKLFVEYLRESQSNSIVENEFNKPLITYINGEITVKEFVNSFDFSILRNDYRNKNAMKEKFNLEIAWFIRDDFLAKTALEKRIDQIPMFKRELELWVDKWIYEEMKNLYNPEELPLKLEKLTHHFPVTINKKVLESIEVTDSKKSKWLTVHNYKMGTNRMAIPIADGSWDIAYK